MKVFRSPSVRLIQVGDTKYPDLSFEDSMCYFNSRASKSSLDKKRCIPSQVPASASTDSLLEIEDTRNTSSNDDRS